MRSAVGARLRGAWPKRLLALLAFLSVATTASVSYASFLSSAGLSTTVGTAVLTAPTGLTVTQTCGPVRAVAFRGASSGTGQDSLTLATPAGVVAGDLLLAHVTNRQGVYPLVPPAGWTQVRQDTTGNAVTSTLLVRVATASEPATATFGLASFHVQMAGGIAAYSGADTSGPVDGSAGASGFGATATTPSLTTTRAGDVVVSTVTKRQEDVPAPGGTTQRWDLLSGPGVGSVGASAGDEPVTAAGATTPRSSTSPSLFQSDWIAQAIALRPVPPVASASLSWTASDSSAASGYRLDRVAPTGTVSRTLTPVQATTASDGPLVIGTAYTYQLRTFYAGWTSPSATAALTPSC